MARLPRLVLPGVALHIVQRGNDRRRCFREDGDYLAYLHWLGELLAETKCALHAYCLMPNHVHLLLTPGSESSPARLLRDLGRRYVRYFNQRHVRTGTLWEGRYHSCLVDTAAYLLACYRYIDSNPVRAGIVGIPAEYRWSSYAANSGGRDDKLLSPHAEYLALARDAAARGSAYYRFVAEPEEQRFLADIRSATQRGHGLVGGELKQRIAEMGRRLERGKPGPRPIEPLAGSAQEELLL